MGQSSWKLWRNLLLRDMEGSVLGTWILKSGQRLALLLVKIWTKAGSISCQNLDKGWLWLMDFKAAKSPSIPLQTVTMQLLQSRDKSLFLYSLHLALPCQLLCDTSRSLSIGTVLSLDSWDYHVHGPITYRLIRDYEMGWCPQACVWVQQG